MFKCKCSTTEVSLILVVWEVTHLKVLQHSELLMFTVHFKSHSKKALDTVEPQAIVGGGYPQSMEPEFCVDNKGIMQSII